MIAFLPSFAVLVKKPVTGRSNEKSMTNYIDNKSSCRRDSLFENFDSYTRIFNEPLCLCCDVCSKSCTFSKCCTNHQSFVHLSKQ